MKRKKKWDTFEFGNCRCEKKIFKVWLVTKKVLEKHMKMVNNEISKNI